MMSFYRRLPVPLQNLAVSLEGYRRYYRRYLNRHAAEWTDTIRRYREASEAERDRFRDERTARYLADARENSDYWRDRLPAGADAAALRSLPVITKADLQRNAAAFVNRSLTKRDLLPACTSGTTGAGLNFFCTREAYAAEFAFCWHEAYHRHRLGDPYASFNGNMIVPTDARRPPFRRRNRAFNQTLFSIFHMSEANLPEYYRALAAGGFRFINGYPSAITTLAEFIVRRGLAPVPVESVYPSSETLLPEQRRLMKQAFACRVRDFYSNAEQSILAFQDEDETYRVSKLYSHVWFKEADVDVGGEKAWRVIGTSFINRAFFIVNYDTGDLVTLTPDGSRLRSVLGRVEDSVVAADGRRIGRLDHLFKHADDVKEAQVVQTSPTRIVLRVVPHEPGVFRSRDSVMAEAAARLHGFDVSVELCDRLPRTRQGKVKFVVSELAPRP